MSKIKVLLVDDQKLFTESLRTVLTKRADGLDITGIAANGNEAIEMVEENPPDIILMDIRMPEMNGVECTKKIREKYPDIKILVLTTFDDDEFVVEALKYGACGYLMKDVPLDELIAAIYAVYNGGVMISPRIASKLLNMVNNDGQTVKEEKPQEDDIIKELSDREVEVFKLLAKGYDNKEIAGKLFVAEQTVKNYVSRIYSKLNVHDRVQATLLALEIGLVSKIPE